MLFIQSAVRLINSVLTAESVTETGNISERNEQERTYIMNVQER